MNDYYIWYNSKDGKYFFGSESQFTEITKKYNDNLIIAEEFMNLSQEFAKKITTKLNENLNLYNQSLS